MEIRIDRHEMIFGNVSIEYRDLKVDVPVPTGGRTVGYLYVDDPGFKGGSPALQYTNQGADVVCSSGRVVIGKLELQLAGPRAA